MVTKTKVNARQFMEKTIDINKFSPTQLELVNSTNDVGNIILARQQGIQETFVVVDKSN